MILLLSPDTTRDLEKKKNSTVTKYYTFLLCTVSKLACNQSNCQPSSHKPLPFSRTYFIISWDVLLICLHPAHCSTSHSQSRTVRGTANRENKLIARGFGYIPHSLIIKLISCTERHLVKCPLTPTIHTICELYTTCTNHTYTAPHTSFFFPYYICCVFLFSVTAPWTNSPTHIYAGVGLPEVKL